jgi:hypothetical protein
MSEGTIDVHQLAEALIIVSETFMERIVLPSWVFKLPIPQYGSLSSPGTTDGH